MKKYAINKRAIFDYEVLEKFEAGLVLKGYEVKSVKTGHVSLKGAFVTAHQGELYLTNANIPLYQHARVTGYDPTASRKLLLHKRQIKQLLGKSKTQGLTMVPLFVYNKKGFIKLSFALAKGKKQFDKRHSIKKREDEREMGRIVRKKLG